MEELQIGQALLPERTSQQCIYFLETTTEIHINKNNVPSETRILLPCYFYFSDRGSSETELQIIACIEINTCKRPTTETK